MGTIVGRTAFGVWGESAFGKRLLTPGAIDEGALEVYRHGSCAVLALVLHDLTGWTPGLFRPTIPVQRRYSYPDGAHRVIDAWWVHAAVLMPDFRVLDIAGPQSIDAVCDYWDDFEPNGPFSFQPVTDRQAFLNEIGTGWDSLDADRTLAESYALTLLAELEIRDGF